MPSASRLARIAGKTSLIILAGALFRELYSNGRAFKQMFNGSA